MTDAKTQQFFRAIIGNQIDAVAEMINNGQDVNARSESGNTPLHYATAFLKPKLEIVKLLVENGADVNARNDHAATPLHNAAFSPHGKMVEVVQYLVEHGADPLIDDGFGFLPIMLARGVKNKAVRDYLKSVAGEQV